MGGPTSVSPFFVKVLHLYLHCATVLLFVSHLCYAYGAITSITISVYFSHSTSSIYSQFLNTSNIQSVEGYHVYKVSDAAVQYRDTSFTYRNVQRSTNRSQWKRSTKSVEDISKYWT